VPFVHIADATLDELRKRGVQKVGLLGTIYTMTQDFYKQRLIDGSVEVLVPNADEMEAVNEVIFDELCFGKILPHSKEKFLQIIEGLR
ncbi:aspartate/glutamate racemase, partial [Escherichia coli]|uniref:aspartate/glutamate racemase family protein n=1 Tax=Escherichia coli TaxID=562 RepID=UPI002FDC79B2|nr:aspartate/glutamate racemase [Escherichia coli]